MDPQKFLAIAIVLTVIGVLTGQGVVTWLGLMLVVLERVAYYWAENALADVSYDRHMSARRMFIGDELTVTITVENDKPLPVTWLQAEEDVAHAFGDTTYLSRRYGTERDIGVHTFSLRWFERVRREVTLSPTRRGVHDFGDVDLQSGDPFGFHKQRKRLHLHHEVVVYPEVRPLDTWQISETALMGMIPARRLVLEDPLNVIASREYRAGDPLRRINWKATARRGRLMTNVVEPTTEATVAVVLNVRTYEKVWEGSNFPLTEECIRVAASLATRLTSKDVAFSLHTNGFVIGNSDNYVAAGRGAGHLADALETLARINAFTRVEIEVLLRRFRYTLDSRLTVLLVTPRYEEDMAEAVSELRRRGIEVRVLLVREVMDATTENSEFTYEVVTIAPGGDRP